MNAITVILVQTRIAAALEIIGLLLVSVIIGYVTAWLYLKYKYRKDELMVNSVTSKNKRQEIVLNEEIGSLRTLLEQRDGMIEKLKNEIKMIKGILANVSQNRMKPQEDNLRMISGIGPFIEERLHAMGIHTYTQISNFTPKDIETMNLAIEYFKGRIERDKWVAQANELVLDEAREAVLERIRERKTQIYFNRIGIARKEEANDLTSISGIGGWIEKKLNALDIYTFNQIANFNKEDIEAVTKAIEFFPGRIERDEWVQQAKDLMAIEGDKTDLLNKIREKKSTISYTRLGVANKDYANNLTLIKGISLWLEERLNLLDIYTFEQISKFSSSDIIDITEILRISPNRIQNDNWIGQARDLLKDKVMIPMA